MGGSLIRDPNYLDNLREGQRLMRENRTATEVYLDRVDRLNELIRAGAIDQDTYNAEIRNAAAAMREAGAQADQAEGEISEFAREAARNIQDQLGDTIEDVLLGNFDNIEDAWRRTLANMAAEAAAAQVNEYLFGKGEGVGGVVGSVVDAIPGFADGGRPQPGYPAIVGERGPELFVPDQAGTVIPNGQVQKAAQQAPPQVNQRIVNALRPEDIADALNGPAGEEVILNTIGRNPETVRGSIG
jgi:hypothetical protein